MTEQGYGEASPKVELSGNFEGRRADFDRRFFQLDLAGLAARFAIPDEKLGEFIGEYRYALFAFEFYQPANRPSAKKIDNHFLRLEKSTADLLEKLDDVEQDIWQYVQHSYEPQASSSSDWKFSSDNEGLTYAEYEHEAIQLAAAKFLSVIRTARANARSRNFARSDCYLAHEQLVRVLASIYQRYTGLAPRNGFRFNVQKQKYEGSFVSFIESSISDWSQRQPLSRIGLGVVLHRVLAIG